MKFLGLDGREYTVTLKEKQYSTASNLHKEAREVLNTVFPNDNIYEEVTLPGSQVNRQPLTADFFIPSYRIIVEVQGEQHYKFNKFHYKDKKSFLMAKARDNKKREWCEINGITLIELRYDEKDVWEQRINEC